jgi:hypothetical protein|tara:strand:- start:693 stop:881 length:189 start_codon:yes stop_codon:yes gene_type:complete
MELGLPLEVILAVIVVVVVTGVMVWVICYTEKISTFFSVVIFIAIVTFFHWGIFWLIDNYFD